jgi:uncharacterized membrane protein
MVYLTDQSIWYDEAFDVLFAQQPLGTILSQAVHDTVPPLHYLLLHGWMWLGKGELAAKLFSVFFGVMATALMCPVGRRLFGPKIAIGGALLLAVSPFQVYYAREVRMYSQLLFFGLMSVYLFVRCLGSQPGGPAAGGRASWRDWIGLVIFTALAVHTHTVGFLVPLVMGVATLVMGWRRKVFLRRLVLSGLTVTALALPWALWVLPAQVGRVVQDFWVSRPSALAPVATLQMFLVGYAMPAFWAAIALLPTLQLTTIAVYQAFYVRQATAILLVVWLLGPLALGWILSQFAPIYLDRLFIASAPALYLLLAWSLDRTPRGLAFALGGLLAVVILVSLGHYYWNGRYHKPPMRDAARYVARSVQPSDVVLHTCDSSFLTFAFYEPQLDQFLATGDPEHRPGSVRAQSLALLGYAPVDADQVMAEHARVWLVVALDHSVEAQLQIAERVMQGRTVVQGVDVGGISVYLVEV